ncbi:hypothetical protein [Saccharopolyspora griseoalba]|uniref:Uncharacterized protein n=1 Tax=Saccharopolyspora griseoalba TaxID=1431848 RepID=A0ABW2LHR3_9PSEU
MARTVLLVATLLGASAVSACGWFATYQVQPTPPAPPPPPSTVTETVPQPPGIGRGTPEIAPSAPSGCFAGYQTQQSSVQLCSEAGQVYYYGSSQSGSIALPAHHVGGGAYQTASNDGYVYTISPEELVITQDGAVVSEQPVLTAGY